jgi:hypothetical protein
VLLFNSISMKVKLLTILIRVSPISTITVLGNLSICNGSMRNFILFNRGMRRKDRRGGALLEEY